MTPNEFVEYYEKYLIGDINAMMEKADQENNVDEFRNQLAVPITSAIFSILDVFGFLIRNDENDESKVKIEFKKNNSLNIAYAILKWNGFGFPEYDIQNLPNKTDNDELFKFINIYRHGIMHTFFPKAFSISNVKEGESRELFYKIDNDLVFNVRKFYLCLKSFIESFKNELLENIVFQQKIEKNINLAFNADSMYNDFNIKISQIPIFNVNYSSENVVTTTEETTKSPQLNIDSNITSSLNG